MLDHPVNPLKSPFAPSFLATYRCASGIIKASLNHFDRFPELCGRWWGIWTHCTYYVCHLHSYSDSPFQCFLLLLVPKYILYDN